jgi:NTE family protein
MADRASCILVLQGGGALGAYQAGVFEALVDEGVEPDWVAGISIGAVNCALVAGNEPRMRVPRLREFWELVSSTLPEPPFAAQGFQRTALNEMSATNALLFGVPGFFRPWVPPAAFQLPGTTPAISVYDTEPLRRTLERLVDFDRINAGPMRFAVGAVNVRTGDFAYFDSARQQIDVRHVMASGALPPGFPPIEIDGEQYWDGGLVSNTPLQYVLDEPGGGHRTVFQVDLFAPKGEMPATLGEVAEREKDIRYSSRTRLNTTYELRRQATVQAAQRLLARLPARLRDDPDARLLAAIPCEAAVDVVHLIYRSKHYESQSKDYEFSRASMLEHWAAGLADTQATLEDPRWLGRDRRDAGVHVYDLASASPRSTKTITPTTGLRGRS